MTQQGSFLIFFVGFFDRFQGCMPSVAFICLPLLRPSLTTRSLRNISYSLVCKDNLVKTVRIPPTKQTMFANVKRFDLYFFLFNLYFNRLVSPLVVNPYFYPNVNKLQGNSPKDFRQGRYAVSQLGRVKTRVHFWNLTFDDHSGVKLLSGLFPLRGSNSKNLTKKI